MPYDIKEALSLAKQARRCPPPGLQTINGHEKFLKKHMDKCPYCGTTLSLYKPDDKPWEKLAEQLNTLLQKTSDSAGPVKKGELRRISSDLAGWRDDFYYTPPLVIVYEIDADFPEIVQVVQVYDDILLAGPGDLILTDDITDGAGSLLVECWNSYTLKADLLGPPIVSLSKEVMAAVDEMVVDETRMPSWALLPPPMMEYDPRIYFRELEVEVAYTFASHAASELIDIVSCKNADSALLRCNVVDLREWMKKNKPGIKLNYKADTPEELVLSAEFPGHALPKAANDKPMDNDVVVNCALFRDGVLIDFKPALITDLHISRTESKIEVSGTIETDLVLKNAVIMGGWYIIEKKEQVMAAQADLDGDEKFFYLAFDLPGNTKGNLKVAIEIDM